MIEGNLLIAVIGGKPGACVVAFDKRTGKEVWRSLDDPSRAFSSPILISTGGQSHLIVWTPLALAHRHVFARNDRELICASLAVSDGEIPIRTDQRLPCIGATAGR